MVQLTDHDFKAILEDLCGRDEQREAALLALRDGDERTLREIAPNLSTAASLHVKQEAARLQTAECRDIEILARMRSRAFRDCGC